MLLPMAFCNGPFSASSLALEAVCFGQVWPYLYFRDWPLVASNPCVVRVFKNIVLESI